MKIGILTFQNSINYGAQLQCYALKEFLKQLGHDVEVINYTLTQGSLYRGLGWKKNPLKALIKFKYKIFHYVQLKKKINEFRFKYLNLTPVCDKNSIGNITADFDAIIFGSDQIWGNSFHDTKIFFGNWQPEFKGKRISYSPCCAVNQIAKKNSNSLKELLLKFSAISVRNHETQLFVKKLININPIITVDPTLLYDFSEFKLLSSKNEKYILTYILGTEIDGGHKVIIDQIKKAIGPCPVYSIIVASKETQIYSWMSKKIWNASPTEWIRLIQNCSYFYTDSFHGLIFAVKLNIPVIAYYSEASRKSRFIDLAKRYLMHNLIVSSTKDAVQRKCIKNKHNYSDIISAIEDVKQQSIVFIKTNLE